MQHVPPAATGTALRILATTDLGAAFVPVATTCGHSGTCDGVAALLDSERAPTWTWACPGRRWWTPLRERSA